MNTFSCYLRKKAKQKSTTGNLWKALYSKFGKRNIEKKFYVSFKNKC